MGERRKESEKQRERERVSLTSHITKIVTRVSTGMNPEFDGWNKSMNFFLPLSFSLLPLSLIQSHSHSNLLIADSRHIESP